MYPPCSPGSAGLTSLASAITTFKLNVTTTSGPLQIPQIAPSITLSGRQSKVVVTDYHFGSSSKLAYSTAQVFFAGSIDGRAVLFLHGDVSQDHEAALQLTGTPNKLHQTPPSGVQFTSSTGTTKGSIVSISTGVEGLVTIWDSDTQLILYADSVTAATFWAPVLAGKASDPLRNFWGMGTNETILVGGPYLVREASIKGGTLALRGDLKENARLTVIAPRSVRAITWNGERVGSDVAAALLVTSLGGFVGELSTSASATAITIPKLTGWKFMDSLPEISRSFDDKSWALADKRTTNIPLKPYYGDGRVLYGCDYGL